MSSELSTISLDSEIISLDQEEVNINNRTISITTNDGVVFDVPDIYLKYSTMLQITLEDLECTELDLSLINSQQLSYVLEYIKYLHINKGKFSTLPKPIIDKTLKMYLAEWELNFINKVHTDGMIAKLADASNYLDVKPLLDLVCAKIAGLLKGNINSSELDNIINSL